MITPALTSTQASPRSMLTSYLLICNPYKDLGHVNWLAERIFAISGLPQRGDDLDNIPWLGTHSELFDEIFYNSKLDLAQATAQLLCQSLNSKTKNPIFNLADILRS